jgi:TetR/AcrR family transcriptional regulator
MSDAADRTPEPGMQGRDAVAPELAATPPEPPKRRPQPGERRAQILQALAAMLEAPGAERITTAALAARLTVSEAALYRHFASKAQMFDALIDFIEETVFALSAQILLGQNEAPTTQAARIVALLLQFCERNPGLARVLAGDALLLEHERLQQRVNQCFERLESQLRQCLRAAAQQAGSAAPTADAQVAASCLIAFSQGRLQRFVRSQFRRLPTEQLDACLARML